MRIAIVDDIKEERTLLHGWLYSQLSRRNVSADIVEFESGEEWYSLYDSKLFIRKQVL